MGFYFASLELTLKIRIVQYKDGIGSLIIFKQRALSRFHYSISIWTSLSLRNGSVQGGS